MNAQDTVQFNFETGKQRLLKENLQLMAEYYSIDIAEAEIQQAGLWDNPLFVWNAEMYSMAEHKYFAFENQKLIQLEYAFSISGKRVNAIKEAKIGKELALHALSDVMRGLVYEYSLQYLNLLSLKEKNDIMLKIYTQFQNVIELNQRKLELGVISENDLTRLKSENLTLYAEINQNRNEIAQVESDLRILLNLNSNLSIQLEKLTFNSFPNLDIEMLINTAKQNRPDYLIAHKNIEFYAARLRKQKSEAIPNINLGYQPLDQGSNHVRPYSGMVFEMGIPIFNRNQGNISASKIQIEQSKVLLKEKENEVENQVVAAINRVENSRSLVALFTPEFIAQMDELSDNAKLNYEKRNISLIEYIDYQRAYIENQKNRIDVLNTFHQHENQLSFFIGKSIFNLNN